MANVKKEILKVIKIYPEEDEDRQSYLLRVVEAIALLEEEWDDFSEEAQDWANAATIAAKDGKTIPDFPGEPKAETKAKPKPKPKPKAEEPDEDEDEEGPEPEDNEDEDEDNDEEEVEVPKAKAADKKKTRVDLADEEEEDEEVAKPKTKRKKKEKAAKDKPTRKRGDVSDGALSPVMYVREYFLKHPDTDIATIQGLVEKKYNKTLSSATLSSLRNDFRSWMRLLNKHGLLNKDAPEHNV